MRHARIAWIVLVWAAAVGAEPRPGQRFGDTMYSAAMDARFDGPDPWRLAHDCAREPSCGGPCDATLEALARKRRRVETDLDGKPVCAWFRAPGDPAGRIGAYVAAAAVAARAVMGPLDAARLDCSQFGLGLARERPGACAQADARDLGRALPSMVHVDDSQRLVLLAEMCAELATCAPDCAGYMHRVAISAPETKLELEPCPDAAKALAGVSGPARRVPLERWVGGKIAACARAAAPRFDDATRRAVDCALGELGLGPACPAK
jgi:hypothetical protein